MAVIRWIGDARDLPAPRTLAGMERADGDVRRVQATELRPAGNADVRAGEFAHFKALHQVPSSR